LPAGLPSRLAALLLPAGAGAGAYLVLARLLGIEELTLLWKTVRRRLQRKNDHSTAGANSG